MNTRASPTAKGCAKYPVCLAKGLYAQDEVHHFAALRDGLYVPVNPALRAGLGAIVCPIAQGSGRIEWMRSLRYGISDDQLWSLCLGCIVSADDIEGVGTSVIVVIYFESQADCVSPPLVGRLLI